MGTKVLRRRVHGSGKNSGNQQPAPHVPREAPNDLQSNSVARIVDLVSEGEVQGLVNGLQSIFFDQTPLQNADGSFNYTNVIVDARSGLPDQTPILGFSDVENEVSVNTQVKNGSPGPIVRTVTNPDATSLRVAISIPQLTQTDSSSGDVNPTSVSILVEVQPNGGTYVVVVSDVITGKTTAPYERAYRFALPGDGPWNVRVSRLSPDSTSQALQNQTFWARYTEIADFQLIYPDSALAAFQVDAQSFGNTIPKRTYEIKGIKVQVPSNYDPLTRIYTGLWDGTFKTAWTDNPVWAPFYDLVTNERYGLGQFVPPAFTDKFGLYPIAQYCDGMVPDGRGGFEPRYRFNGVIATADDAIRVLTTLASVFRGMVYWGSAGVAAVADMPSDPVKLVVPGNVIDGTINYSGSALKARHTIAFVTWYDPENAYQPTIEAVEDADAINRFGWRLTEVVAFGCTSRGQAHRFGRWILDSEKNETETGTWTASWDQADVAPGEIVEVADPAYSGADFGGRITAVASDAKSITLDRPVTLESGKQYSISVVLADGTIASRPVTTGVITTRVLSFDMALSPVPVLGAIWVLTSTSVAPRQFRIVARTEIDKHLFQITALFHDPTKYARIEQDIVLETPRYSALPSGALAPPANLAFHEHVTLAGGTTVRSNVLLSWVASPDSRVDHYEVQMRPPGQNWQPGVDEVRGVSASVPDLYLGTWGFRTRAVGTLSQPSAWLTLESCDLVGLQSPPDDVDNFLFAYDNFNRVQLSWTAVEDIRPVRYEIRKGASWDGAQTVADVAHAPWGTTGDGTYFIAAYVSPAVDDRVYSENARSLTISESVLVDNIVVARDEQAEGFLGDFTGNAATAVIGGNLVIRTGGSGNILDIADVLATPSLLNYGGQADGFYASPHVTMFGRSMPFRSSVQWLATGVPDEQNLLSDLDVLSNPDVLSGGQARLVDVYPVMRLVANAESNILPSPNILAEPDVLIAGLSFGPWQRWTPDVQNACGVQFGMALEVYDATVIAVLQTFAWVVDVEDRLDRYTNLTISAGGTAISFVPKGYDTNASGAATAFIGGSNGPDSLPHTSTSHRNPAAGDLVKITNLSLAGCTVHVMNAGVSVGGNQVDLFVQGY